MGALSPILRNATDGRLTWWCPGCDGPHQVAVGEGAGPRWGWNGDASRPTFTPSVLVTWREPAALRDMELLQKQLADRAAGLIDRIPQADKVCHSFVVDGAMQFLGDCTHALAGQTVPIPEWPRPDWGGV